MLPIIDCVPPALSPAQTSVLALLVSAFGGACLALFGQWLGNRYDEKALGQRLVTAFWEELSATNFYTSNSVNYPGPAIGGYSSQTFDTLYAEMVRSLPATVARDLMRYHLRMKYLWSQQVSGIPLGLQQTFYDEAKASHADLLGRLDVCRRRRTWLLALRPELKA